MRGPDRRVIRLAGFSLLALLASGIVTSPARACSTSGPGINLRSVWPGPDQRPPTNSRLVVFYGLGPSLTVAGVPHEVPALGPDVVLLDADGAPVDISFEVVGGNVIVVPSAALLPGHNYQLADRRTVPCNEFANECELLPAPVVFASFTTAATADSVAPVFGGLASVVVHDEQSCDNDACCGPYKIVPVDFLWSSAADDLSGADVRYNLYRRSEDSSGMPEMELVAPLMTSTQYKGAVQCEGNRFGNPVRPGRFVVRSVDWAGNEDTNLAEREVDAECDGCGCASGGSGGGGGLWWLAGLAIVLIGRRRRPS